MDFQNERDLIFYWNTEDLNNIEMLVFYYGPKG